jgi:predicted permease
LGAIFLQILPLFIIIAIGWFFVKIKIANQNWLKPISDFSLYIGFPALIFANLTNNTLDFNLVSHSFQLVSFLLLGMLILILIGLKFFKSSQNKKATYIICFLFGNAAFLGIPIITTLAPELTKIASVNAAIMLFWVFSLGLIIVEYLTLNKPQIKQITINLFKNPLLLSVIFGLGFNYLQIPIPKVINQPLHMLSQTVSPMIMLLIGIFIALNPPESVTELKSVAIFSLLKLLIFPVLGILCFNYFKIENSFSQLTQFAMPAAITPFAMAERYKLDLEFICNSIILSTIISLFSLPLVIYLINFIG